MVTMLREVKTLAWSGQLQVVRAGDDIPAELAVMLDRLARKQLFNGGKSHGRRGETKEMGAVKSAGGDSEVIVVLYVGWRRGGHSPYSSEFTHQFLLVF